MNNLTSCDDDSTMVDSFDTTLNDNDNNSNANNNNNNNNNNKTSGESRCLYTRYQNDYGLTDYNQYPSFIEFDKIIQQYLNNLSDKKRDKALVDNQRYHLILQVLKDPKNTAISTAQFRFWVKKMFQLSVINGVDCVIHDDKPVATREEIHYILVMAHTEAHHGGRDKTSALVRKQFSWIPKELIAKFVRHCPFCISRRNGCLSPVKTETEPRTPPSNDTSFDQSLPLSFDSYTTNTSAAAAAAAVAAAVAANNGLHKLNRNKKACRQAPRQDMLQDDFNFTCYRPSISMAATVATSAAAAAVASTYNNSNNNNNNASSSASTTTTTPTTSATGTNSTSPFPISNFDFYYSRSSEWKDTNKLPSPKPDKVLDLGMPDFSKPKDYSIKSNVASVAELAAIAAVYKPYQPSSPDLTDSSASSVSSCSDIFPTAYSMI